MPVGASGAIVPVEQASVIGQDVSLADRGNDVPAVGGVLREAGAERPDESLQGCSRRSACPQAAARPSRETHCPIPASSGDRGAATNRHGAVGNACCRRGERRSNSLLLPAPRHAARWALPQAARRCSRWPARCPAPRYQPAEPEACWSARPEESAIPWMLANSFKPGFPTLVRFRHESAPCPTAHHTIVISRSVSVQRLPSGRVP